MMPPEVTRFSTMKGWPSSAESDGARMRATRSLAPPGLAGTTRRTGRTGYCAQLCKLSTVPKSRRAMRHILAIITCLLGAAAQAQDYPVRPIRLIVPIGPGGGTDILARHMAQKMTERLRASVVVENRPGAGSIIGTDYVAKAPPDGYTLLVGGIFNMVMNKALVKNLPYEPLRDFVPLGYISAYPFALGARAGSPGSRRRRRRRRSWPLSRASWQRCCATPISPRASTRTAAAYWRSRPASRRGFSSRKSSAGAPL